jgi:hypothetical protein
VTWLVRKGSGAGQPPNPSLLVTEFYHPLQPVTIGCTDDCKPSRHLGLYPSVLSTAFNRRDTGMSTHKGDGGSLVTVGLP